MRSKKVNQIIAGQLVLLTIITGGIILKTNQKTKAESLNQQKQIQLKTNNEVDNWKVIEEKIKDECSKENLWICLDGQRQIRKTYSVTDDEIQYKGNDNAIKWLANKLNEWKTRDITIDTVYNYEFVYDMDNIDITIDDKGVATVKLSKGNISLRPLAEDSSKRVMSDSEGILSKGMFTTQEISSIMNRTMIHSFNQMNSDNELYEKSLHSVEENIKDLISKFGIKKVNFECISGDFADNNEVENVNDINN